MSQNGALMVLDARGVVVEWSSAAEALLGRSAQQVLGSSAGPLLAELAAAVEPTPGGLRVGPLPGAAGGERWGVWTAHLMPDPVRSAVLEAVFAQSPLGLHVLDTDLRVIRVNTAAIGMRGIPEEQILGRPLAEVYQRYHPQDAEKAVRAVLATGEPSGVHLIRGYPPKDPEREHVFAASAYPLRAADGQTLGVVAEAIDVTERERTQGRLELLHTGREQIGQSLDVMRTAQALVDVTVPALADSTVVALSEAVLRGEDPNAARGHRTPPLLRCAATGRVERAQAGPEVGAILLPGIFGDQLNLPSSVISADRATLTAPLTIRGAVLGAVAFHRTYRSDPFEQADLALAESLAGRTALCLDNALRYTREHTVIVALQGRPTGPYSTEQSTVEIGRHEQSTGQGGASWSDVIPLSGARVALVVGRVHTPGIRALAVMSQLRTAVHTLADLDLDPHDLLARLHDTAERLAAEHRPDDERPDDERGGLTASCTFAVYDPVQHRCAVAQAGSHLLLVARPDGSVDPAPIADGPLLASGGPPFSATEFELTAGSTLCLASHRPAGDGPALNRLVQAVSRPDRPVQAVADGLGEALDRDAVVLVARTRDLSESQVADWDLPAELTAVSRARRLARDQLARWEPEADSFAVELVVSELVTNAIRYGTAPITLRLVRERTLTLEVSDGALTAPHLRHAKAGDEGGRGLLISASLADNWGVRYTDSGKTVWAELPLSP